MVMVKSTCRHIFCLGQWSVKFILPLELSFLSGIYFRILPSSKIDSKLLKYTTEYVKPLKNVYLFRRCPFAYFPVRCALAKFLQAMHFHKSTQRKSPLFNISTISHEIFSGRSYTSFSFIPHCAYQKNSSFSQSRIHYFIK